MNWLEQVDNYCERTDFTFWSEPINAITNGAFLLAALAVWAILGGKRDPGARLLVIVLAAIGTGSFLFHTFATGWAATADVLPILIFILVYVHQATSRFFDLPRWAPWVAVIAFVPYSAAVTAGVAAIVGPLSGSVAYVPVPILILIYAALVARRDPGTARGLAIGALILIASLTFRTVDEMVCASLPLGTHFLWHVLNGIMLGWMIVVLHRHVRHP